LSIILHSADHPRNPASAAPFVAREAPSGYSQHRLAPANVHPGSPLPDAKEFLGFTLDNGERRVVR
jgi:hypothetical protein